MIAHALGVGDGVQWWHLMLAANLAIACSYLAIAWRTWGALIRTRGAPRTHSREMRKIVGAIFFTCAVGHALHAEHLLSTPWSDDSFVFAARQVADWHIAMWDTLTGLVGVRYWILDRRT